MKKRAPGLAGIAMLLTLLAAPPTTQASCKQSALKQTQAMIRAILNDLTQTYTRTGGGGITRIEQKATLTYVVSIAQEEATDQITYELKVGPDCKVTIARRTPPR